MDMTIKVNLLDPNARDALRALLSVLDQKDEAAPKGKPTAAAPEPVKPPAQPAAAPPAAATEPAAGPAEGDGEAVLTVAQREEVVRLQTVRVQDVDQARAELKDMLQKCFAIGSLSQLLQKWLPKVEDYAKTGNQPDEIPFL